MLPLLEVKHLKMHFPVKNGSGYLYAVDDVDLELQEGKTLGVVGESGCGKSTLARTIMRLNTPTAGEIFFQGEDIGKVSGARLRQIRKSVQMIFQDPYSSLNPRWRVEDILAEPFHIHGETNSVAEKIAKLLGYVGLSRDSGSKFPHEFSGGQRQRIGIARALALNPKIIIADEPVSALDVSVQSQILNLLMDLREELSLSYIFIAHDLAVVEHISDEVAVMYLGKIVERAPKDKLFANPRHPYTQALLQSIPKIENATKQSKSGIFALGGDVASPINRPSGCHFHPRCPKATDLCKQQYPEFRSLKDAPKTQVACHYA